MNPCFRKNLWQTMSSLWWVIAMVILASILPAITTMTESTGVNASDSFTGVLFRQTFQVPEIHYDPRNYSLPIVWLIHHILAIVPVTYSIWKIHLKYGSRSLLLTGSRKGYFHNMYTIVIVISMIIGLLRLGIILMFYRLSNGSMTDSNDFWLIFQIFSIFIIEDSFFCLLTLVIALYFSYQPGIISTITLILISSFFPVAFLPGQGSMALRQVNMDINGHSLLVELVSLLLYFSLLIYFAERIIYKYDFYTRNE